MGVFIVILVEYVGLFNEINEYFDKDTGDRWGLRSCVIFVIEEKVVLLGVYSSDVYGCEA